MSYGPVVVGLDVGATKVIAAAVDPDGRIVERLTRRRTPDSASESLVGFLVGTVQALRTRVPDVRAVGVGIAGLVTWPEGEVEFAANHAHRSLKLRRNLASACGLPVIVENDANAAAWAEASGRPTESLLFLAVGTGLGSGFVIDGELVRGPRGRGAEFGHVVVDRTSERRCSCGQRGCLEVLASGLALRTAGEELVQGRPDGPLARRVGRRPPTTRAMINAALAGDPDVVSSVRTMGHLIGRAVAENLMALLPVDRVAVGGGLAVLDHHLIEPMRFACEKTLARSKYLNAPRIGLAASGPDAVLVGAALLAHQKVGSPSRREEPAPV